MLLLICIFVFILLFIIIFARGKFELTSLSVNQITLNDDRIDKNINFVFLSDLHENKYGNENEKLIDEIINQNSDLIVIGGDLPIAYKHKPLQNKCKSKTSVEFLNNLKKANLKNIPILYSFGNHEDRLKTNIYENNIVKEQYDNLINAVNNNEIVLIENSYYEYNNLIRFYSIELESKYYKPKFEIFKDSKFDEENYIESRIGRLDKSKFNILLLHTPDYAKECINYGFDLVLSGHYHGGLIGLPFGFNLIGPNLKIFPKYVKGIFTIKNNNDEDKTLIVSPGLGTHSINLRLNNKPQLINVSLCKKDSIESQVEVEEKIENQIEVSEIENIDNNNDICDNTNIDTNITENDSLNIETSSTDENIVTTEQKEDFHAEFKDGQINYKLEVFEGPLDLLLQLIERNKINIYDIPISEITRQYMDYIKQLSEMNMEISSEFVVMASNLLEIKSKMLLPFEVNDKGEEIDPRAELVERLLEHKRYMSYGDMLKQNDDVKQLYRAEHIPKEVANYVPPVDLDALFSNVDIEKLNSIFKEVLDRKENSVNIRSVNFGKIYKERIPLKTKIVSILDYSRENKQFSFRNMLEQSQTKTEVIVTFLAILELIKMGKLSIEQNSLFGDIKINYIESDTTVDLSSIEDA